MCKYKKTVWAILLTGLFLFVVSWVLISYTKFGPFLNETSIKLVQGGEEAKKIKFVYWTIFVVLEIVFGILGYNVAKRRNRDKKKWSFLCLFFNLWAFIVLITLPKNNVKE